MYRVLLIASLLPILVAMVVRWWCGVRVLGSTGKIPCRCDLGRWLPAPAGHGPQAVRRAADTAAEFGRELRAEALRAWRKDDPKAATARENTRRFGMAVPPLTVMVAVFALLVGKVPVMGVFALMFAATALSAAMALLGLPAELRAIARHANRVRSEKSFPDPDDEQAVIDCAIAHAWDAAVPPVLRWLQG